MHVTNPTVGVRRVAMVSMHTSPLEQPGIGDAGGMNVYLNQLALHLAQTNVAVDIFTRRTDTHTPDTVDVAHGVRVRHITAGPSHAVPKAELPFHLEDFAQQLAEIHPGRYDLLHSHYWLSGHVGITVSAQWKVPLVHTAHTWGKVKNAALNPNELPEPQIRLTGEQQIVAQANQIIVNTPAEALAVTSLYQGNRNCISVIPPGVELNQFKPGDQHSARQLLGVPSNAVVIAFVGRIQPLKAPDILLRGVAKLVADNDDLRNRLVVLVVGGPSGDQGAQDMDLVGLAHHLGIAGLVRFLPPRTSAELALVYQSANVLAVPSFSETFGLVALEAQASGTPVVAAAVGGLAYAVEDNVSGLLVSDHRISSWSSALHNVLSNPLLHERLSRGAIQHANQFTSTRNAESVLATYRLAQHCALHTSGMAG